MRDLRYNTEEEDDVAYSNYMMNNMQNDTCNNSIWALGEISKTIGTNANGFIGMAGIAFLKKFLEYIWINTHRQKLKIIV